MKKAFSLLCVLLALSLPACDGDGGAATPSDPPASGGRLVAVSGLLLDVTRGAPLSHGRVLFRVARDGATVLSGEAHVSDDGRFVLGIYLEPEDILTLEGTAPGYLPSRVHLAAGELDAGEPVRLGLEPASRAGLVIQGHDWRPTRLEETIQEWPQDDKGGLLSVYVRNDAPLPLEVDQVTLNGRPVAEWVNERAAQWWRIRPDPIPAGAMAALEIKLAEPPPRLDVGVYPLYAQPAHALLQLSPSPLLVSYITWAEDGERLLIFAHNQATGGVLQLEEVWINGAQVPAEPRQRDLSPGETALIVARPPFEPQVVETIHCQVKGSVYQGPDAPGSEASAWGAVRSLLPVFPVGTWPQLAELDGAALDALEDHGMNTLAVSLPRSATDPSWDLFRGEERFHLLAMPRFPALPAQLAEFAAHPRLLAWFVADEPEYHLGRDLLGNLERPMDPGDSSDAAWRLGQAFVEAERAFQRLGGPPTYGNLSSYKLLPKYAPALDLAGVSHYAVDAWAANGRGAHPLEDVYTYTLGLRYHTAPAPIWPWVQALCDTSWYENTGACWNRLPTPAEMRAQLYLELAAGAKGVLWYTYHPELVAQGAEQWQEVGRQNRLLGAVSDLFLYGDVAETVQVDQGRVLARAIVSEGAVAIPVVNLDYDWEPYLWRQGEDPPPPSQPYRFRERSALSFSVLLPQWIQPQGAWAISPEGVTPLAWSSEARVLRFELAGLRDVALVVVGEEAVAEALSARLRP